MKLNLIFLCTFTLLIGRAVMAENFSSDWVTFKDSQQHIVIDFPHRPLEMTFDIPFQNTPPKEKLHIYSVSTNSGILILGTLTSDQINESWIQEKSIYQFFETVLVPHLFFNPAVFDQDQVFKHQLVDIEGKKAAAYQISYQDHDHKQQLEGFASVKEQTFYFYFYLASEKLFDRKVFEYFTHSFHLVENQ